MHMYGIWSAPFSCLPLQHTLCVDPCTAISVIGTDLQPWPCSLHIVNALWKCCQSSCKHLLFINSCHTHTHMQTHAFPHHCSPPTHTQTHTHTHRPTHKRTCIWQRMQCRPCLLHTLQLMRLITSSSGQLVTTAAYITPITCSLYACTHAGMYLSYTAAGRPGCSTRRTPSTAARTLQWTKHVHESIAPILGTIPDKRMSDILVHMVMCIWWL